MQDTTKADIDAMEAAIAADIDVMKKLDADIKNKYERLEEMQANCKHDFELIGAHAGAVFECKICGMIEGG